MPRQHNGERTVSLTNGVGKIGYPHSKRMSLDLSTWYIKTNSKWIKDLNIWSKTLKLLEETWEKLYDTGFGNDFLDMTLKTENKSRQNWIT